jgi:5-deoxy-D-glucuronate isomerase
VLQQVYTADRRLDELVRAQDNDTVILPKGSYHAAVTAHGYPSYSLNIVVGSAQSLTSTADPTYAYLRADWGESPQLDPRLPLVSLVMERP